MTKKKKTKKFSLNQRIDHYLKVCDKGTGRDNDGNITMSNKARYASGYIHGASVGVLSGDFDTRNRYNKLGQKAGVRAFEKSRNIKF